MLGGNVKGDGEVYNGMNLIWVLLLLLVQTHCQNRVIEITTLNIELVLRSLGKLHLLLHNPNCPHSRSYSQRFLEIKSVQNLGIADCSRQLALCQHLNVTHYPTLLSLANYSVTVLDEQEFLTQVGAAGEDGKAMASRIVQRLRGKDGWAAVVLEEEGLPTIDKVEEWESKGVFYVSAPSELHSSLLETVHRRVGCWILSLKDGEMQRYYCGSGFKPEELSKYLQNFEKGKLKRHIFSKQGNIETNSTALTYSQLNTIVQDLQKKEHACRVVYFHSALCEHCSQQDTVKVKAILQELRLENKIQLQTYDLDSQELPHGLRLRRLPELYRFCSASAVPFGGIFTLSALSAFLSPRAASSQL